MGLGWFDAIAPQIGAISLGTQSGRFQAQEEERKRAEDALRYALLNEQIKKLQQPEKWEPTTMQEAQDYELKIHPERTEHPWANQPEWVRAGFENSEAGRQEYLRYTGQKARAEYPDRFTGPKPTRTDQTQEGEGDSILSSMNNRSDKVASPFAHAYAQVIAKHPDWAPGRIAYTSMQGLHQSQPGLFRQPTEEEQYQAALAQDSTAAAAAASPAQAAATPPTQPPPPPGGAQRPPVEDRIFQLKAQGMSKEQAYQILQSEGYLDQAGNLRP